MRTGITKEHKSQPMSKASEKGVGVKPPSYGLSFIDHQPIQQKEINGISKNKNLQTSSITNDVVQGYFKASARGIFMLAQEKRETETGSSYLNEHGKANIRPGFAGIMRISNDRKMAIEDGGGKRQAKTFYATKSVLAQANKV